MLGVAPLPGSRRVHVNGASSKAGPAACASSYAPCRLSHEHDLLFTVRPAPPPAAAASSIAYGARRRLAAEEAAVPPVNRAPLSALYDGYIDIGTAHMGP